MKSFLFLSLLSAFGCVAGSLVTVELPVLGLPLDLEPGSTVSSSNSTNTTHMPRFEVTGSLGAARPPFSNKTGCPLSARPAVESRAHRDLPWTLLGLPTQACCDDLNCDDERLPQHPGDCSTKIKCGAPCPAEPVDAMSAANFNPMGAFDTCKKRAPPCVCATATCLCCCQRCYVHCPLTPHKPLSRPTHTHTHNRGQQCVCTCHCVCKYPSGRIHWVFA